jgi:hypothetical protein
MTAKVFFVELADAQKAQVLAHFPDAQPGDRHPYESIAPGAGSRYAADPSAAGRTNAPNTMPAV